MVVSQDSQLRTATALARTQRSGAPAATDLDPVVGVLVGVCLGCLLWGLMLTATLYWF